MASSVKLQTSMGDITIELFDDKAPITVTNFLDYVKAGFYDGLIFHRVIKDFMIQGGGFDENMKQKNTNDPIKNEAAPGLDNERGTLAMARTNAPDSATAQFFINHRDNSFLNYQSASNPGYAVFGKVTDGIEVVDKIAEVQTGISAGMEDVPKEAVKVTKASVI
jgi:cyclophilin family peptidyl-prolyl cis-trans isomerase